MYHKQSPVKLASFAMEVLAQANEDTVSTHILMRAAEALVSSWHALQRPDVIGCTVLGGGVLNRSTLLAELVQQTITNTVIVENGLVGVGILALEALGLTVSENHRKTLEQTIRTWRIS